MKGILMMAVLLGTAMLTAEDVTLNTWDLSKGQCTLHREKGVEAKSGFADGVYRIEVLKNLDKKALHNIQFWCNSSRLQAGIKYRVDFTVKSITDAKIFASVMLTASPWTRVVGKNVSLKTGEVAKLSLEFSLMEDATSAYRTPSLFLGEAAPGTVFEISDIKLVEVPPLAFSHSGWELTVDGSNGSWRELKWRGTTVAVTPPGRPAFLLNAEGAGGSRMLNSHSFDPASGVASIVTVTGEWRFEERLTFGKRLHREVLVTNLGKEPVKFKTLTFYYHLPKTGGYYFPRSLFGDTRHYMQIADQPMCKPEHTAKFEDLKTGTSVDGVDDCYFAFAEQTSGRTLAFIADGRRESTRSSFQVAGNFVQGSTSMRSAGWAMPDVPQRIGPVWLEVFDGDAQAALRSVPHAWFREVGMLPPADPPEWLREVTSLWVFGTQPTQGGVDGFRGSAREMVPYAKQRGANLFWILPVNIGSYGVRDYYKLPAEVGTKEDYREFLTQTKTAGIRVVQDIVPHGGRPEYGLLRNVSPFTISIAEDGTFVNSESFDYGSTEWRKYMTTVATHFMKEFEIDGFRIDQPASSPINWRRPGFPATAPVFQSPWWDPADLKHLQGEITRWWNDAVAKNGETVPPVDGPRGSFSSREGGAILTGELRRAVMNVKPDGIALAEAETISCVPGSDTIFDFYIRRVGLKMALNDGQTTAQELARFLEEQQFTDPPGTLRVRFLEVHDSQQQRFTNWCGESAGEALRTAIFWSKGIPHVLASTDVGMGVLLQRLNAVRAALPELRKADAEYLAVGSNPAVFTALRVLPQSSSIGVTSFLPRPVRTCLEVPVGKLGFAPGCEVELFNTWNGVKLREGKLESFATVELDLPAYGYAVLTWRPSGSASPLPPPETLDYSPPRPVAPVLQNTPDDIIVESAKTLVINRKTGLIKRFGDWLDGSLLLADLPLSEAPAKTTARLENGTAIIDAELADGAKLRYVLKGTELEITGTLEKFSPEKRMAFTLAATETRRWQVESFEGRLDDFIDKNIIDPNTSTFLPNALQAYRPRWSPILWHSEVKPLHPGSPKIRLFGADRKGFEVELDAPRSTGYDDLMLLNRLPGKAGLHLALFWVQPGPLSLAGTPGARRFKITLRPAAETAPAAVVENGVKVFHDSMFWRLENDSYTLRLTRNGGVIRELRAKKGGSTVISDQDIVANPKGGRASFDLDTGVRCYSEAGKLKLRFLSALRNAGNSGLFSPPVWAVTEYALDSSERISQSWKVYLERLAPNYTGMASPLKELKLAYTARRESENVNIPVADKLTAREWYEFSAEITASGAFKHGIARKSAASALPWERLFQLYATGSAAPLPLMIASEIPGSFFSSWYSNNTRFALGHRSIVSVETRTPGFSFFGPYVELIPGKYRVKTWIKGENISKTIGRSWVRLWLEWTTREGKPAGTGQRFEIPLGTFAWQPLEAELVIPEDAEMPVAVMMRSTLDAIGDGTVWVDIPQIIRVEN